jgi:hypothetical protein
MAPPAENGRPSSPRVPRPPHRPPVLGSNGPNRCRADLPGLGRHRPDRRRLRRGRLHRGAPRGRPVAAGLLRGARRRPQVGITPPSPWGQTVPPPGGLRRHDAGGPLPQHVRPVWDVRWRAGEGPCGAGSNATEYSPGCAHAQGDCGEAVRQRGHRDLGRRDAL